MRTTPESLALGRSFSFAHHLPVSTQSAAYAPSGPSVVGAALDLCMPILFNFHLFYRGLYNHYDAPMVDQRLLPKSCPSSFRRFSCFVRRFHRVDEDAFWGTMKYTFMALFHASLFRDSFLGDVLTSLVRPFQDIAFVPWPTMSLSSMIL